MNLPDLKQLDKLISLCRKRGIKTIKVDNVEITLGDPQLKAPRRSKKAKETKDDDIESDGVSEEALLFWSTTAPESNHQ